MAVNVEEWFQTHDTVYCDILKLRQSRSHCQKLKNLPDRNPSKRKKIKPMDEFQNLMDAFQASENGKIVQFRPECCKNCSK